MIYNLPSVHPTKTPTKHHNRTRHLDTERDSDADICHTKNPLPPITTHQSATAPSSTYSPQRHYLPVPVLRAANQQVWKNPQLCCPATREPRVGGKRFLMGQTMDEMGTAATSHKSLPVTSALPPKNAALSPEIAPQMKCKIVNQQIRKMLVINNYHPSTTTRQY